MRHSWRLVPLVVGGLVACDSAATTELASRRSPAPSFVAAGAGGPSSATGGGHYLIGALDVQFAFSAVQTPGGAVGRFHQKLADEVSSIDVSGAVTCLAVDPVNGRAWIGGVVTENRSTEPTFQTAIHQPGRDVWFRFVDYGEGQGAQADRTTFLGFEGAAGIITSAEYCVAKIWPDDDARTNPLTAGNIQVR